MLRAILAGLFLVAAAGSVRAYDSYAELDADFLNRKIVAIDEYVAGHPGAADAFDALLAKLEMCMAAERSEDALATAEKIVDMRIAAGTVDTRLASQILRSAASAAVQLGDKARGQALVDKMVAAVPDDEANRQTREQIPMFAAELRQPAVGEPMDIEFTAVDGRTVSIKELTESGKVVLVDFWATWCGPCIGELPNVKKAYAAYADKGFEIVGISLDRDKAKLESFVKENGMTWPQYFDGKQWANDLGRKFGINSIPATYLIGKDGKVTHRNLRGPALEKAVGELLN